MRRIRLQFAVVGICSLLVGPAPIAAGERDRPATLRVPGHFRTLGAAIEAAPDGATILIGPGVHRQEETLRIDGKRLRIIGSDEGRTELVSSSRDVGLLTYANGGGGEVKDLHLVGGAYGVGADPRARDDAAVPSRIALKNVSISEGYRGIYGAFSSISAKNVVVHDTEWNGISLTHIAESAILKNVEVFNSLAVGLWINNTGPGDVSIAGHYHHNALAGVKVQGNNGHVAFFLTIADHNGLFGVFLDNVEAGMALSSLVDQVNVPPVYIPNSVCEGAGLSAVGGSVVTIAEVEFRDNCLGIGLFGSTATVKQSTFDSTNLQREEWLVALGGSTFGPSLFEGPLGQGGGENVCGYHLGTAGEIVVPCVDFFEGEVSAPPPLGEDALE